METHRKKWNTMSDNESLWEGLFRTKTDALLLLSGLVLILCNVFVFFGTDVRPSTWLFYLNMHYWSGYISLICWIAAIWVSLESTDFIEDYLPLVRLSAIIGILLAIVFALQSSTGISSGRPIGNPLWLNILIVGAIGCIVRSLYLLYDYQYGDGEYFDLEEAQWFWAVSGYLAAVLAVVGLSYVIYIKEPVYETFVSTSLFKYCAEGLWRLYQFGEGTFALRGFGLLLIVVFVAFLYVAGKWALIFLSRMRGG
jgi:hypothetical protein